MAARTRTKPAVPTDDLDEIEEDLELEEDTIEEEAPKPKRRTKVTPAKKAPRKPVVVADEDEDEGVEDEDEAPVKKPVKKAPAKKAAAETKGTAWLVDHVNEQLGTEHPATAIRVVLRRLAKDGKLDREVGETRTRYEFSGPNDAIVKAVVKAVKSGAVKADRDEKLTALKAKKAAAAVEVDEDEVEELEDDE